MKTEAMEEEKVSSGDDVAEAIKMTQAGETEKLKEFLSSKDPSFLATTRDWTGDTLLAVACWHEHYETAKMLLELGAAINTVNNNSSSPLHRACYRNNIELAILLMNHGADYSVRDKTGRKPYDVGDRIIRKVIKELERVSDEENHRLEEIEREKLEEQRYETIAKRQRSAVPVIISGAKNSKANGTFEPVDEVSCDWPVYSKRGDRDIWLLYLASEPKKSVKNSNGTVFEFPLDYSKWVVQSTKDKGGERAYVEFESNPPAFPELRLEGSNGIVENEAVLGVAIKPQSMLNKALSFRKMSVKQSPITIVTEEEASADRATEMFKKEAEWQNNSPISSDEATAHTKLLDEQHEHRQHSDDSSSCRISSDGMIQA